MIRKMAAVSCMLFLLFTFRISVFAETIRAISHGSRDDKAIALTFDDGPHPRYTPEILDLLDRYHIKATFFMIGKNVSLYPELAQRVAQKGHEIGSHTYSHPHMLKLSSNALLEEIKNTERIFSQLGLPTPKLFRPPEGYRTEEQCSVLKEKGYRVVVWSLDTHDWKNTPAEEIVKYVLSNISGGDILLFHDYISGQNTTITALEQIIPKLLADGYRFVNVSELTL